MGKAALSQKLVRVWGPVRKSSAEKIKSIEALTHLMESGKESSEGWAEGKKLFEKTCANCHVLFGEGGKVGPDLTGSNRKDLGYLLENIVDPSSSVADSYRSSIVELADGRTITGVVLNESKTTVEIQTAEKRLTLDRNDIERIKKTANSLMPENLLNELTDKQKRLLLLYLMSR